MEKYIVTSQEYSPYGSALPGLQYNYADDGDTSDYRFGFNGEERMNEHSGEGMAYHLGDRMYDGRLGKMFGVDPLDVQYTWQSPFSYCYNTTIGIIDEKDPQKGDKVKQGEGIAASS